MLETNPGSWEIVKIANVPFRFLGLQICLSMRTCVTSIIKVSLYQIRFFPVHDIKILYIGL